MKSLKLMGKASKLALPGSLVQTQENINFFNSSIHKSYDELLEWYTKDSGIYDTNKKYTDICSTIQEKSFLLLLNVIEIPVNKSAYFAESKYKNNTLFLLNGSGIFYYFLYKDKIYSFYATDEKEFYRYFKVI